MTEILVVDRDPVRREGLAACLRSLVQLRFLGGGATLEDALGSVPGPGSRIDILLINIDLPQAGYLRFWSEIAFALPVEARVVAMTAGQSLISLELALAARVAALCRPDADPRKIRECLLRVASGVVDYDPELAERIKLVLMLPSDECEPGAGLGTLDARLESMTASREGGPLTWREKQVLRLIAECFTNRQIADRLRVSPRTVEFHVTNVLRKLRVSSRTEAAIACWRLLPLSPTAASPS